MADTDIPSFLKLDGERLIFNKDNEELVAYIPEKFFERKMAEIEGDYTRYFLDDLRDGIKIEIFVLKTFLKEKLGIDFTPRTIKDCF